MLGTTALRSGNSAFLPRTAFQLRTLAVRSLLTQLLERENGKAGDGTGEEIRGRIFCMAKSWGSNGGCRACEGMRPKAVVEFIILVVSP